jgi:two-component SAPR family response regulator
MVKLKCLVVDDEPLARKGLKEYIREMDILEAVGECNNASDALEFLQSNSVDLIFLDIQMPGQNGLEFLREIKNPPMAIITTAFVEFALESFELDVIDYLVKPIPYNRFVKAAIKAKDFYVAKHITSGTEVVPYIFVKIPVRPEIGIGRYYDAYIAEHCLFHYISQMRTDKQPGIHFLVQRHFFGN